MKTQLCQIEMHWNLYKKKKKLLHEHGQNYAPRKVCPLEAGLRRIFISKNKKVYLAKKN